MECGEKGGYILPARRLLRPNCHRMVCVPGTAGIGSGGAPLPKFPDIADLAAEHSAPTVLVEPVRAVRAGNCPSAHVGELDQNIGFRVAELNVFHGSKLYPLPNLGCEPLLELSISRSVNDSASFLQDVVVMPHHLLDK